MQYPSAKGHIGIFEIVYNLAEAGPDLFLPNAYVVSIDREGYLAHIQQRAMEDTITHFGLELTDERRRAFSLIERLQPKVLEQNFSPPRRKLRPLEVLLKDRESLKAIQKYAHRHLNELLEIVHEGGFPLTWNVERKVLVKDFVLEHAKAPLQVQLFFERMDRGVRYRLNLKENGKTWKVRDRDVVPITNEGAWLFVDYVLYRAEHMNGFMVKPFRQRDEVIIPEANVKTYFQKFIVKVASKLEIEAEGFEVVQHDQLLGCRLEVVPQPFEESGLMLTAKMLYPHEMTFDWYARQNRSTRLEFGEEDVRIIQIQRRQDEEAVFIEKINQLGLQLSNDRFWVFPEEEHPYRLLEWLIEYRIHLEDLGFEVATPCPGEQPLYLHVPVLDLASEQTNDWFDIMGQVKIGEFNIPFLDIAKYIREDNRFFPLPNGRYFLIFQEWMARYRPLVQFAKRDSDHLRLNKNQFTLLQELGLRGEGQVSADLDQVEFTTPNGLKAALRPYQLDGVKWLVQLYRNELGACLADDMGLGKTLQTITLLLHAKEQKAALQTAPLTDVQLDLFGSAGADESFLQPLQALIILPASLVFNWESEVRKFAPAMTVYKHVGPKRHRDIKLLKRFDLVLTTYQTALRDVDLLGQMEFEYIVLDESQQIKNRESKVFKAINTLQGKHKVSLSGTPIENSLSDLWSQMQFINPDLLGSFSFFKREFITPIEKHQVEEKKDRLRTLVAPYLLRRTKEEVASDLPPLTTKVFYSEMTKEQKRLYEREKSAARNFLLEHFDAQNPQYRMQVLRSLTKLRQLVNHPSLVNEAYEKDSGKFNDILEHWEVIRKSEHKALFFSSFVQYLELFRTNFEKRQLDYAWLSGSSALVERQRQIQRFETEQEVQSFLISIKSGGSGLNLTAADYVFILDPWWNPTTEQQAIARAHRIGQEKNVIAVKFITRDSIEEKILKLQDRKSRLAEDIIDNVRKAAFSRGDIEYLLE